MKKIHLLLSCASLAYGAAQQVPNQYQGKEITAHTLYELAQKASPMPDRERQQLDSWLQKDETKVLLNQLLRFNFANGREFMEKGGQDNQLMVQHGLTNESQWNYVFDVPGVNYHIKIAGPINRLRSALMERGIEQGQKPSSAVAQEILVGKIPTYQTASRAAYFLVLKEFLSKNKLQHIDLLPTHLLSYSEETENVSDDYALILEPNLSKDAQKITQENRNDVSQDILSQLVQAIIGVGLWNIEGNIFLDKSANKLYIVDLEQPNNSAPKDFFHKDAGRYYGNINAGLEGLLNMFAGDVQRLQYIRQVVESNPVVQSADYNAGYKRELINMLNQKAPA